MSDTGLNSMIQASKDQLIDAVDFSRLGRPTASYVVERKTVRMPFLAPTYTPDGVTVMRCTLADHGWLDPATLYMQCVVNNTASTGLRVPLTSSINGAFSRGRLLSGQLLEDILMYGRVTHLYENLKVPWHRRRSRSWALTTRPLPRAKASACSTSRNLG